MTINLNDFIGTSSAIPLAKQGEFGREVSFDFSEWVEMFGSGSIGWSIQRPQDTSAYLLPSTEDGTVSVITLTETESQKYGYGLLEVFYVNDGETEKRISKTFSFRIDKSLQNLGQVPSPWQSYVDAVHEDALKAEEASQSILDLTATATVDSSVGTPSVAVEVTTEEDHKNMAFAFSNIKGEQGEQGETGNGISSVSVAKTATVGNVDTYTMTISYTDGDSDTATYDVTNGEVTEEEFEKAFPTDTASGSIASYPDGADMPIKDLKVSVTPVQDLHGYANPWVGGAGANIWDEEWELGVYNSSGVKETDSTRIRSANYIPVIPNTSYYFLNTNTGSGWLNICEYGSDKSFIDKVTKRNATYTVPSNVYYLTFDCNVAYGTTYHHDIAINYPNTVTTYSPYSNICPITGWTGANVVRTGTNVWDEVWEVGVIATNGNLLNRTDSIRSKNYISVAPNTDYYLYIGKTIDKARVVYFNANNTAIGNKTAVPPFSFTTPSGCAYIKICTLEDANPHYGATYLNDISINYPSTDHSYHAYSGNTYSFPFGQTVYGGTLDVTSGVLTVTKASVDLGSLTWTYYTGANVPMFYADISGGVRRGTNEPTSLGICSCYRRVRDVAIQAASLSSADNYGFAQNQNSFCRVLVVDARYSDAEAFTTAVTGQTLTYELASPQTVQLSPTEVKSLLGQNNIFADCGDSDVEYLADVTLYIQKLTGSTEDDMIANQNIANNKYFMVGNRLFFSTSAIAMGASIIVGTNCTETNLADALNALNS